MAAKTPPPSDELLRQAWRQIRRDPHWPATLEAALEIHLYRTCLLGVARNIARRGSHRKPPSPPRTPQVPWLPLFDDEDAAPP